LVSGKDPRLAWPRQPLYVARARRNQESSIVGTSTDTTLIPTR
jgi:hypothetical protein